MARVLVTGGAGYIGSVLVRELLAKGHSVKVIDSFGEEPLRGLRIDVIKADICNDAALARSLDGIDAVVHLAAIVGDSACKAKAEEAVKVNYSATVKLAKLCRKLGVPRLIFASTCSVYGFSSRKILDEESPANPLSLYAQTKLDAEKELRKILGSACTILRFGTSYGVSPRMRFDLAVNGMSKKAVKDGEITVFGGQQVRPFIHVRDISAAICKVVEESPELVGGQTFNVAGKSCKMEDVGRIIHKCVPDATLTVVRHAIDARSYNVSAKKIKRILGYSAGIGLEEGVEEVKHYLARAA